MACSRGMSAAVTPSIRCACTSRRSTGRWRLTSGSRARSSTATSAASTYLMAPRETRASTDSSVAGADHPPAVLRRGLTTRASSVLMYTHWSHGQTYTDWAAYGRIPGGASSRTASATTCGSLQLPTISPLRRTYGPTGANSAAVPPPARMASTTASWKTRESVADGRYVTRQERANALGLRRYAQNVIICAHRRAMRPHAGPSGVSDAGEQLCGGKRLSKHRAQVAEVTRMQLPRAASAADSIQGRADAPNM